MSNQTAVIPERSRNAGDLLRDVLEMLVPIMLTLTIIGLIAFRVDVTTKFHQTARTVQLTACQAVKESNDASYDLWRRQIMASPSAKDPRAIAFLADIKATNAKIEAKCLGSLGTPSEQGHG